MFNVYNLIKRSSQIMSFSEILEAFPDSNLLLLRDSCISVISVYENGKKIAVINRIKEEEAND